mmetsp:Transcript_36270/g.95027  ORF Transcript_36270/g.95027 Transcript_36270/m.95027 type:complete len:148 (+) Transcript_36270:221-664(+)
MAATPAANAAVDGGKRPDSFAAVVRLHLLGEGTTFSGGVLLGPTSVSLRWGDGDSLGDDDLETVREVSAAALEMHPAGEPRSLKLGGHRYTVTKCERAHVLAVTRHEERGVIISALPHAVLVALYTSPTRLGEAAAAVYKFAALLRA